MGGGSFRDGDAGGAGDQMAAFQPRRLQHPLPATSLTLLHLDWPICEGGEQSLASRVVGGVQCVEVHIEILPIAPGPSKCSVNSKYWLQSPVVAGASLGVWSEGGYEAPQGSPRARPHEQLNNSKLILRAMGSV